MQLLLFTTAGCHLCEQAVTILDTVCVSYPFTIQSVEIGDDDALVSRYGVLIPVLQFPDGTELNWPFSAADIVQKMQQLS